MIILNIKIDLNSLFSQLNQADCVLNQFYWNCLLCSDCLLITQMILDDGSRDHKDLVYWLVHHFGPDWNISTTIGLIAMKFSRVINGFQRMNPNDFGDPMAFALAPLWGLPFVALSEASPQHWMDVVQTFMSPSGLITTTLVIPSLHI